MLALLASIPNKIIAGLSLVILIGGSLGYFYVDGLLARLQMAEERAERADQVISVLRTAQVDNFNAQIKKAEQDRIIEQQEQDAKYSIQETRKQDEKNGIYLDEYLPDSLRDILRKTTSRNSDRAGSASDDIYAGR